MKNILKFFAFLLILTNSSCKPQMVQTTKEAYLLKENEQQLIDKPLNDLLKEVKPEIKTGYATNEEGLQYFSFKFRTPEQWKKDEGSWDDRVSIYVYVKDPIDWQYEKRSIGKETVWTKEDAEKYGNLIVTRIKVINQP